MPAVLFPLAPCLYQRWTLITCEWRLPCRRTAPLLWALLLNHRLSISLWRMGLNPQYHRTYQPSMLIVLSFYVLTVQAISTPASPPLLPPHPSLTCPLHRFDTDVGFLLLLVTHCLITSVQNSNVVEFVSLLKKDDPSKQLVYYQVRLRCFPFDRWFG